jgi:hypothetical protein
LAAGRDICGFFSGELFDTSTGEGQYFRHRPSVSLQLFGERAMIEIEVTPTSAAPGGIALFFASLNPTKSRGDISL